MAKDKPKKPGYDPAKLVFRPPKYKAASRRAALTRFARWVWGRSGKPYPGGGHAACARDACTLAWAYIEQALADDSLPLTEEWLEAVGTHYYAGRNGACVFRHAYDDIRVLERDALGSWYLLGQPLPQHAHPKTCGDVRTLCRMVGWLLTV